MKIPLAAPTLLDRVIAQVSPERALRRLHARTRFAALTGGLAGGYRGARRTRRPTEAWATTGGSPDADLLPDLATLRERSRDLERNVPLATGALATVASNVVGAGLACTPAIDAAALGLSPDAEEAWEAEAARLWAEWSESAECHLGRTLTFRDVQRVAFHSCLASGDEFVVRRWRERPGSDWGLKLQLIEGDRVSNPKRARDSMTIAGGVELDEDGAPVAYHIADRHPGDTYRGIGLALAQDWTRVPAFDDTGERLVLHLYRPMRDPVTRGAPYLAPVVEALKQLGDYGEAELQAAVVAAMFTVFIQTDSGEGLAPVEPTAESGGKASDKDLRLAPGMILDLAKGESVEIANPGRPNDKFDPFVMAILRQVGVALELPYEVLIKHFTASYSAARGALLEAWKFYRERRAWLVRSLCQPVYGWVITEAVARGRLAAPGFLSSPAVRRAYLGAVWIGPGMQQIDPLKENQADALAEDRGWKTAAGITAEKTGGDWDRNMRARAREQAVRREAGLVPAPARGGGADAGASDDDPDAADRRERRA